MFWQASSQHIASSSHSQMLFKIGVLKDFAVFTGKHMCLSLFLIKLQAFGPATILNETPKQVFSCEYCEIVKNSFVYRTPPVATSGFMKSFPDICWHQLFCDGISFYHPDQESSGRLSKPSITLEWIMFSIFYYLENNPGRL